MNSKTFLVDSLPNILNPQNSFDYNSKLIQGFLFKPIFFMEKSKFKPRGIIDNSYKNRISLTFSDLHWSDGSKLSAQDFYKTLEFMLKRKERYASYLSFIKGVKEFVNEEVDFDSVKMWVTNDVFHAEVHSLDLYKDVFSSINFSPLKFIGDNINYQVTSGNYILDRISSNSIILKSDRDTVKFELMINPVEQLKVVSQSSCTYSGLTSLTETQINSSLFPIFQIETNIIFNIIFDTLKINDAEKNIIMDMLRNKITNYGKLTNILTLISDHFDLQNYNISLFQKKTNIKIAYPDYYPNHDIVSFLKEILESLGYFVTYDGFEISEFVNVERKNYDIFLELNSPVTLNKYDFYVSEIPFIKREKSNDYISLFNFKLRNMDLFKGDVKLDKFISKYSNRKKLGYLNLFYAKSKQLDQLKFTKNGIIIN